ncbi:LacI family transcriptional regulator [Paraburkholderia monticola]|uniref:LacI family transcriptional regulator n=1 Tax=Paraburkholderia monticola TaxID=1399968 RepID=A0A149PR33_9BURK|nr:LacI family DNA-binding transcriptional regulator [Paraburkholderia monticola]KXU87527.1 LacI family transcriptional regulator [Paraburkholderia monticola]
MSTMKITLRDLAKKLGVHPSTVSRVINPKTRHLVGEKVAAQVLAAARDLGYRPNSIAASLRTKRSNLIGVLLPDITNPMFPLILLGIEEALSPAGYTALVVNAGSDYVKQQHIVEQMQGRQIDGLIVASVERDDPLISYCLAQELPVVTVNRSEERGRVSCVVNDDVLSIRLAVDHLVALGHTQIGHVLGPLNVSTSYHRHLGFQTALIAQGLPFDEHMEVESTAYTREAGARACETLLTQFEDVTAVIAGNDLIAIGCLDVFRRRGIACPADISLVGHNDTPLTDVIDPPLTTVRIKQRELGVQSARILLSTIDEPASEPLEVRLKPELVVRASTAPPRRTAHARTAQSRKKKA